MLFTGSSTDPVDYVHIGNKCNLPLAKHRLQRFFSRRIDDTKRDIFGAELSRVEVGKGNSITEEYRYLGCHNIDSEGHLTDILMTLAPMGKSEAMRMRTQSEGGRGLIYVTSHVGSDV